MSRPWMRARLRGPGLWAPLLVVAVLAASGVVPAAAQEEGATGGTVRLGINQRPETQNIGIVASDAVTKVWHLIYDTPIEFTLDGTFGPRLAETWEVSEDGKTWTLKIRSDATWHDGTPLTAEDVKFSLEMWRDIEWDIFQSQAAAFTTIEAPDPTTVVITMDQPIGNFESRMAAMWIVPQHIWGEVDDPQTFDNAEMIGSGAFKLEEWVQDQSIVLSSNPDYWGDGPFVDGVTIQYIQNPDARIQALKAGDVDMIDEVPPPASIGLRNEADVALVSGRPISIEVPTFYANIIDEENCPEEAENCPGRHPALKDHDVRLALAHAVDNDQLIQLSRLGLATPGLGLVPPLFTEYFASDVERPGYDPAAANGLLDAAGYVDTNGDGIRECKPDLECGDRPELTFNVLFSTEIPEAPRELEQIRSWFAEIGVGLTIEPLEENVLLDRYAKYDWDMIRWHWFTVSDPGFLLEAACTCGIGSLFNETGYSNERVDELYNLQKVEPDPAKRAEQIREIQTIMNDDLAYVSIPYYPDAISAHRTDTFTGWPDDSPIVYLNSVNSLTQLRPVSP